MITHILRMAHIPNEREVMTDAEDLVADIEALGGKLAAAKASITKRFIGQERVVDLSLIHI